MDIKVDSLGRILYRRESLDSIGSNEALRRQWMQGRLAADAVHSQLITGGADVKVHIYWLGMLGGMFIASGFSLIIWRARRRRKERENWTELANILLKHKAHSRLK